MVGHCYGALLHRLQQSGLRLGCGSIDFVSENQVGEYRSRLEAKRPPAVATILHDVSTRYIARAGYARGVPMGGDLPAMKQGASAPGFLVAAMKDPEGGNLDRIQIIKGWLNKKGKTEEKVHDVAWSDDRKPGVDGKLPLVGNTVNVK